MNPKVSVIIAIDDEGKFLEKCLNSLINQTLEDIEILCINNGARCECKKICEKLKKEDERIRFIDMNKGRFAIAKYIALKTARGQFLTFIDANDWVREDYLEKMYNLCTEKSVDVGICKLLKERNYYIEPEEKYDFEKTRFGTATLKEGFKSIYYNFSLKGKLFSTKIFKQIKVTDSSVDEDILAGYLLLKRVKKSVYTNYGGYIENKTVDGRFEKIKLPSEKFKEVLEASNSWDTIIEDVQKEYDENMLKESIGAYSRFIVSSIVDLADEQDTDTQMFYLKELNEKVTQHKVLIKKHNKISKHEKLILNIFLLDYRLLMLQNLLSKKA